MTHHQFERRIQFLSRYAIVSTAVLLVLVTSAFARTGSDRFTEITVERINVVEPDGRLKLVMSNAARQTQGMVGGVPTPVERPGRAGLVFFNDAGDEIGGIGGHGQAGDGHVGLVFDQFQQDEVLQLVHLERTQDGQRVVRSGLRLADRPMDIHLFDFLRRIQEIQGLEGPERAAAIQELRAAGAFGAERMQLARTEDGSVGLHLHDGNGVPRLRLQVARDGTTAIEFLDEGGAVIRRLTPDA